MFERIDIRIDGDCQAAIASRLAPTLDRACLGNSVNCGSELARDGGVTVNIKVNVSPDYTKTPLPPKVEAAEVCAPVVSGEQSDQDDDRDRYAEKEQQ